ncbi:autotransporter domain-containing protein [Candidimonas humi]|uniref:Autotransporter domain-containing protein n=1 Tax=Candidimonas humi TaxID=683355 RepID=A0ABV8NT50_9BURK|nr:autotransporter domain-containing protein [Candidimonas humi]MBV6305887.1 autotransporter domain-containing protein [Candidimonas humi]
MRATLLASALLGVYGVAAAAETLTCSSSCVLDPGTTYTSVVVNAPGVASGSGSVISGSAYELTKINAGGSLTLDGASISNDVSTPNGQNGRSVTASGAGATAHITNSVIDLTANSDNNYAHAYAAAVGADGGGHVVVDGGSITATGSKRTVGIEANGGGSIIDASNLTIDTYSTFGHAVNAYTDPNGAPTTATVNLDHVVITTHDPVYADGIQSANAGASVNAVDTDVVTSGAGSFGAEVFNGATASFTNGSITTAGAGAAGLRAYSGGSLGQGSITASGTHISTSGSNAAGALGGAENSAGNVTLHGVTIDTAGDHSPALESAYGGTVSVDNSSLTTHGLYSYGAYAHNGGAITLNGGSVTTANATGQVIQDGDGSRAYALYADGTGSSVSATNGTTILTNGQRAYGGYALGGGNVNISGGSITTNGFMAYGVYASGAGSTLTTNGTNITTTGDSADAVWAYQGGVTNVNGGVIDVGGDPNINAPHETANGLVAVGGDSSNSAGTINATGITLTTRGDNSIGALAGGDIGTAQTSGIINLNNSSITNVATSGAGRGILASYAGSSVSGSNNTISITGAGTGWSDMPVAVAAESQAQVNLTGGSISATGAQYTRGILATTGASVTTNGTAISTTGNNSHAVHAWGATSGEALVPTITINGGTITTTGDNSWGLYSQRTGNITSTADITTSGLAGFGAFAEEGAGITLNGGSITTTGGALNGTIGSFGVLAKNGSTVNVNNVAINTSGALADGLRSDRDASEAGGIIVASNTTVNTSGANANGVSVYGGNGSVTMTGGSVTTTGAGSSSAYLQDNATASFTGTSLNSAGSTFSSAFTQAGQSQNITLGSGTSVASNNGTLLGVTRSGGGADGTIALALQDGSFAQGNVYDPSGADQVTVTKGANAHWAGLVVDSTTQTVDPDSNPTQTGFSSGGNVVVDSTTPVNFTGTTSVGGDFSGATGGSTTFSGPTDIAGNLVGAQGSTTNFTGSANIGSVTGGSGSNINFTGSSTNIQGDVSGNQGTQISFSKGGSTNIGGSISLSGDGTSTHGGTIGNPIIVQGDVTVGDGALLGGNITSNGSLGGSGGTVGPGNSVGVQSYASSAGFTGNYFAEVNAAGKSDLLIIRSGNFDLSGIGLTVGQENRNGGYVLNHRYTIIQTPGGSVVNKFASTGLDSSFDGTLVKLDPVIYDPQDVQVTLSVDNSAVSNKRAGLSKNQNATLDGVLSVAGANAAADAALQSTDTGGALNQLSGEVHASTQSALLSTGDLLVRTLTDRMRGNLGAPMVAGAPVAAAGDLPAGAMPHSSALPLWAQVVGDWQTFKGGDDGTARSKLSLGGLYLGGDTQVGGGWRAGGALGYTNGRLNVDGRDSRSDLQSYTASIYGGKSWQTSKGRVNFLAGAAYTRNNVDTRRNVTVGGNETLKSSYHADAAQLFTELGYAMPMGRSSSIEPYARLAWINLRTQGFNESGGAAALHGDSSTDSLTTTTLGLRGATELAMGAHTARLTAGLGWRHAGGDVNPKTSLAFIQGSGSSFNVSGAPIARDAAVLDLGAEMAVGKRTTVGLSYGGQYGAGNSDSAGNLYLKMRF